MNMKKTMAALAACAVAVSAMATTVSAVEDQTLTYDLTAATKVWEKGTAVLTANLANVDFSSLSQDTVQIGITGLKGIAKNVTITLKDSTGGAGTKVFTYGGWGDDNYFWSAADGYAPVDVAAIPSTKCDVTISVKVEHNITDWAASGNVSPLFAGSVGYITEGWGETGDIAITKTGANGGVLVNNVTQATKKYLQSPMETTLNNNYNIINYLTSAAVNGDDGNSYVNVGPVLNDAIENYETVTFKFNSAKDRVRFDAVIGTKLMDLKNGTKAGLKAEISDKIAALSVEKGVLDEKLTAAKAAFKEANNDKAWEDATAAEKEALTDETTAVMDAQGAVDAKVAEIKDWNGAKIMWFYTTETDDSTDYSKFTQHLYNGFVSDYYFAKEGTNYLGLDWAGYNLFQGGLVINEGYTMSLADTTMFDWGESSVSFDWDTIADAAQTSNAYALYLHSMELATSVDWYWDSMDVILTAGAVDDATSDAGATADDEVLEDEEIEEEVTEEEIVEEEIVEEEVEEVVEEVEVENPTTGNASVALAVIPVALAAAAVVAKKRS